jgi:hypothetical protein
MLDPRTGSTEGGEPIKKVNHESTKQPRYDSAFCGAGENTKKDDLNFVLSSFRVFVMNPLRRDPKKQKFLF